jgi:hypothetical protein
VFAVLAVDTAHKNKELNWIIITSGQPISVVHLSSSV